MNEADGRADRTAGRRDGADLHPANLRGRTDGASGGARRSTAAARGDPDSKVTSDFLTVTARAVTGSSRPKGGQRAHEALMIDEEEERRLGTNSSAPPLPPTGCDGHEEDPAALSVAAAAGSSITRVAQSPRSKEAIG